MESIVRQSCIFVFIKNTAKKYKIAKEMVKKGKSILYRYTKTEVETDYDCDFLHPAFHSYAKGEMSDNIWFVAFKPPKHSLNLVDQYIKHRPYEMLSEYFKTFLSIRN